MDFVRLLGKLSRTAIVAAGLVVVAVAVVFAIQSRTAPDGATGGTTAASHKKSNGIGQGRGHSKGGLPDTGLPSALPAAATLLAATAVTLRLRRAA